MVKTLSGAMAVRQRPRRSERRRRGDLQVRETWSTKKHEERRIWDGPGVEEGVGQAFVLPRTPSAAHAAPVLRALIEAVLAGVQRDDIVGARAAAKALVAFLEGMPAPNEHP